MKSIMKRFAGNGLVSAAGVIAALHVAIVSTVGTRTPGPFVSDSLQLALGCICVIACLDAFRRSHGVERYIWRFLTVTFVIWCLGQILATYIDATGHEYLNPANDLIFWLSLIPFGMLPFLDSEGEPNSFDKLHLVDFVEVCVFGSAVFLYFSPPVWSLSSAFTFGPFIWSRNIAFDALLVFTFLLRALLSHSNRVRTFFLRMGIFLLFSGLADSYALNPKQDLRAGAWFDLVWTALLVIPVLIAKSWKAGGRTQAARPARSQAVVINQVFPLMYPFFSFIVLVFTTQAHRTLSLVVFAIGFIALAMRVLAIHQRQRRSELQLEMDVAERKFIEEQLRVSELQYRMLFSSNPIPMWVFDKNTLRFLEVNKAAISHYGFSEEEFRGLTVADIRPPEDIPAFLQDIKQLHRGLRRPETWRHVRKDGAIIDVEIVAHDLHFHGIEAVLVAAHDITKQKQAELALRQAEEKYRMIFEGAVIGIFQATTYGKPLNINRALAHIHGFDSPEQLMREVSDYRELLVVPGEMGDLVHELKQKGVVQNVELEVYRRDRSKKWLMANLRAVRDSEGQITIIEGTAEDITDRKQAAEQVQYLAYYDALTGLVNRALLYDRLAKAIANARRHDEQIAVLYLDLDGFKVINDSLGHSFGDLLLQQVAARLKKWAREQDTVARIGGDEFIVMLTVKELQGAAIVAERLMDVLIDDFDVGTTQLHVSCSVGISIFPEHGEDGETLIKHADAAMYSAKEAGRNSYRFFSNDLNVKVMERLRLEHGLRAALDCNQFFLVYQPEVETETGKIVAFEALLRWQHPELGMIAPDKFIPVAETCGLIVPIGEWVLRNACATARQWRDRGLPAMPIAINVSAAQFRHQGFTRLVSTVLQDTRTPPEQLELELTESLLFSSADEILAILRSLIDTGVALTIDDFGTGYSSLAYLRHFPVSKIKIDRSFIRKLPVSKDDASLTRAIINMAKELGLKVVAEGVETEAQMSFLRTHACDAAQGYLFSKPLTADSAAQIQSSGCRYDVGTGAAYKVAGAP